MLEALCDEALNDEDVRAARIFNRNGELLAHAWDRAPDDATVNWSLAWHHVSTDRFEASRGFLRMVRSAAFSPISSTINTSPKASG